MQRIKLATTPRYTSLATGDSFAGFPIHETTPGAADLILEVPDDWTPAQIDAQVAQWEAQGLVSRHDEDGPWRPEHTDYVPLGQVGPFVAPEYAVGDTYPLVGVTPTTQRRGAWGDSVLIGHCDTGLDGSHPWFAGKYLEGDVQGDAVGHGTFCAGIMLGSMGIATDAGTYHQMVLPGGQGTESGVAQGIRACADRRTPVINLSLGGSPSTIIDNAVRYAQQAGCIVVSAAGNTAGAPIGSPARASDVVVLAIDRQRNYASFTSGTSWTTLNRTAAPGVDDVSAAPGGGITQGSGTSFSAPHVTACCALLLGAGLRRDEVLAYLWEHRTAAPDNLGLVLAEDFGGTTDPPPGGGVDVASIRALAQDAQERIDRARFETRATDEDAAWSEIGATVDPWTGNLAAIIALCDQTPGGVDEPPPPPPPHEATFVSPIAAGCPYGKTKWYPWPQGTGVDLFCKRGTVVLAPCDGVIEEVRRGTGLQGGAEVILATPDKRWAFRFRHVDAKVWVGDRVDQGQLIAVVLDPSLDALGNVPGWFQAPDKYQHLDLSVDQGSDQFSPIGGSGGNTDAFAWLQAIGYQGVVYDRTPGPPDAQHPFESYEALYAVRTNLPKRKHRKHLDAAPEKAAQHDEPADHGDQQVDLVQDRD